MNSSPVSSIEITCACCETKIIICSSCWRNQRYCSSQCSRIFRISKQRQYQKKYRQTSKGTLTQNKANRRYRLKTKNIVSEQSTKAQKEMRLNLCVRNKECQLCSKLINTKGTWSSTENKYFSFRNNKIKKEQNYGS